MTTYLRLLYPQLLPDLLHSKATGNVCQKPTLRMAAHYLAARTSQQLD